VFSHFSPHAPPFSKLSTTMVLKIFSKPFEKRIKAKSTLLCVRHFQTRPTEESWDYEYNKNSSKRLGSQKEGIVELLMAIAHTYEDIALEAWMNHWNLRTCPEDWWLD
jgi:hypothetical protein